MSSSELKFFIDTFILGQPVVSHKFDLKSSDVSGLTNLLSIDGHIEGTKNSRFVLCELL